MKSTGHDDKDAQGGTAGGGDELAVLRAENRALRAEVARLRGAGKAGAGAQLDGHGPAAVAGDDHRQRDLAALTAQLDALIRSSSEVRYWLNADWSELVQLSGGGFIADTGEGNAHWLEEYIPEEHQQIVRDEIRRAIDERDTYHIEHKVNRVDGSVGWALSRAVPIFDDEGEIQSWMGAASDITERMAAQEMQRLLNEELAHRMRNLFGMVRAITSQTLRQADSLEEANETIGARVDALARAQDILIQGHFADSTDIGSILSAAFGPHPKTRERIMSEGPRVVLDAPQALGLSLAVHDLTTNAAKYGALSNETGKLSITWDVSESGFRFHWIESGGPTVQEPSRRGFGSRLIEDVVSSYFGGEGRMEFRRDGLRFTLTGSQEVMRLNDPDGERAD